MQISNCLQPFMLRPRPSLKTIYAQGIQQKPLLSVHSNGQKRTKKIFPHITEEFQYKITNKLLLKKILNPRRDKTIQQNFNIKSISRINHRSIVRSSTVDDMRCNIKNSLMQAQSEDDERSHSRKQISGNKVQFNQSRSSKNSRVNQKKFNIVLQNYRMGKRIINTKSYVEQHLKKSFYTYKHNNKGNLPDMQNLSPNPKSKFIRRKIINMNKLIQQKQNLPLNDQNLYNFRKNKSKFIHQIKQNSCHVNQRENNRRKIQRNFSSMEDQTNEKEQSNWRLQNHQKILFNSRNISKMCKQSPKSPTIQQKFPYYNQIEANSQTRIQQCRLANKLFNESLKLFGKGQTIIMIEQIQIDSNPQLKPDSIIMLELVTSFSTQKHNKLLSYKDKKSQQTVIRTSPLEYCLFNGSTGDVQHKQIHKRIGFAINASLTSTVLPLRIYRVSGVENYELGMIDLDLSSFVYRHTNNTNNKKQSKNSHVQLYKQIKVNQEGDNISRDIFRAVSKDNLKKKKFNKIVDVVVKIKYKVFEKHFQIEMQHN